jgi:predicted nucleotidyltransferase
MGEILMGPAGTVHWDVLLEEAVALLRAAGAREIYVFGSFAEGKDRENSDLDLAVEGLPPSQFFATAARLEDLLGRSIDLVDLDDPTPFTTYLRAKGLLRRLS